MEHGRYSYIMFIYISKIREQSDVKQLPLSIQVVTIEVSLAYCTVFTQGYLSA